MKNWDDQESWRQFFNTYWKLIYGVAIKSGLTLKRVTARTLLSQVDVARPLEEHPRRNSISKRVQVTFGCE